MLSGGNAKGVGATFLRVDNSELTLKDLVVSNYDDGEDTGVTCQFLDGNGRTIDNMTYYWFDFEEEGDVYYGWWDGKLNKDYNNKALPSGEGVWVYSKDSKCTIQCSGAVAPGPITTYLKSDGEAKLIVNPMPATMKFSQMKIDGYDDGEDSGVTCQFLDGNGRTVDNMTYYWFDFEEEGDVYYGWWDGKLNTDYSEIRQVLPGEAVWMYSKSNKCTVTFESPIQKNIE